MNAPERRIAILDDDATYCLAASDHFQARGYQVHVAHSIGDARKLLQDRAIEVALVDERLPDGDGLELAQALLRDGIEAKIVFVTAFGDLSRAVEAMRCGAFDYLQKPVSLNELEVVINRACRTLDLENTEQLSTYAANKDAAHSTFVGRSPSAVGLRKQIATVGAAYPQPILITGETGTGKNLVARSIHRNSPIPIQKFVVVNCAAIPETMFESELFGHERGAFTGAHKAKKGMFELAHGGTLVLDEIGELPLNMQAKLLRVLDEAVVRRVGGEVERRVHLRVIGNTNRDLTRMVAEGAFRSDLYYRLAVICITLPPLRERTEDLEDLIRIFANDAAADTKPFLDEDTRHRLRTYAWPGNVRELQNVIERAMLLAGVNNNLRAADIAAQLGSTPALGSAGGWPTSTPTPAMPEAAIAPEISGVFPTLAEQEHTHICRALALTKGNKAQAAKLLGIARSTLKRKLRLTNTDTTVSEPEAG